MNLYADKAQSGHPEAVGTIRNRGRQSRTFPIPGLFGKDGDLGLWQTRASRPLDGHHQASFSGKSGPGALSRWPCHLLFLVVGDNNRLILLGSRNSAGLGLQPQLGSQSSVACPRWCTERRPGVGRKTTPSLPPGRCVAPEKDEKVRRVNFTRRAAFRKAIHTELCSRK